MRINKTVTIKRTERTIRCENAVSGERVELSFENQEDCWELLEAISQVLRYGFLKSPRSIGKD